MICIIFSFLFHSISQLQWDMAIITMESYFTRVKLQQCFPLCKVMYLLKRKPPGEKQLLLLHTLIIQLRDLSLASVCTAFLIDSPFWAHSFLTRWVKNGCLRDPWLALPYSLYIWGLTHRIYGAKISWVQGQSHWEKYREYLQRKSVRQITTPSGISR